MFYLGRYCYFFGSKLGRTCERVVSPLEKLEPTKWEATLVGYTANPVGFFPSIGSPVFFVPFAVIMAEGLGEVSPKNYKSFLSLAGTTTRWGPAYIINLLATPDLVDKHSPLQLNVQTKFDATHNGHLCMMYCLMSYYNPFGLKVRAICPWLQSLLWLVPYICVLRGTKGCHCRRADKVQ